MPQPVKHEEISLKYAIFIECMCPEILKNNLIIKHEAQTNKMTCEISLLTNFPTWSVT